MFKWIEVLMCFSACAKTDYPHKIAQGLWDQLSGCVDHDGFSH